MLEDDLYITRSKIRRDVLTLFFNNPSKKYYIRQIQRLLGYSIGSLHRELQRLRKDDLLLTEKIGAQLYYKLNKEHPLYNELKSIIMKSSGIVQRLKHALSSLKNIDFSFIYGSFASGKAKSTSDIDVMIVGNPDTSEVVEKIRKLETKFDREINFTIYSKDEFSKKKKETEFLKDVLKKEKIQLVGEISEI